MPTLVVIGIGGLGKWVATYMKSKLLDIFPEGNIPANQFQMLAFDTAPQENPPYQTQKFIAGESKIFELDFTANSPEFLDFRYRRPEDKEPTNWSNIIKTIAKKQYTKINPLIFSWLKEDDAQRYLTARGEIKSFAAGEKRQTARIYFIECAERIYKKLTEVINNLENDSLIFFVGSLAGGTGCGIFLDIALLTHQAIEKSPRALKNIKMFGVALLPTGFIKVKGDFELPSQKTNCFAAFRELIRFMNKPKAALTYSQTKTYLKNVQLQVDRIFDLFFFIDGSTVAGWDGTDVEPKWGTAPAIVDFVFSYSNYYFTQLVRKQAQTTAREGAEIQLENDLAKNSEYQGFYQERPYEAPIFSSFGVYKYIWDVEGVKLTFAHKISQAIFSHFLATSPLGGKEPGKVQDFHLATQTNRFNEKIIKQLNEHPTDPTPFLTNNLESILNIDSLRFRPVNLEKTLDGIGKLSALKQRIDEVINLFLGSETDMADPKRSDNTFHGFLNYCGARLLREFVEKLRAFILEKIFNNTAEYSYGQGVLDYALKFLKALEKYYLDFNSYFADICKLYPSEFPEAEKKLQKFEKSHIRKGLGFLKRKGKKYIELRLQCLENVKLALLRGEISRIVENQKNFTTKMKIWVEQWIETLKEARNYAQQAERELESFRKWKENIIIHKYLTHPSDEVETELFNLFDKKLMGDQSVPPHPAFAAIKSNKLPEAKFDTLVRLFKWAYNDDLTHPQYKDYEPGQLVLTVPGLPPWRVFKTDPKKWNYEFVRKTLNECTLDILNERINIFDIFALLGEYTPQKLADELEAKSSILVKYDSDAQQNVQDRHKDDRSPARWSILYYPQNDPGEPGSNFFNKFKKEIGTRGISAIAPSSTSQEILAVNFLHHIRPIALPCLMETEPFYRQRIAYKNTLPAHVLLGEKLAAQYYEQKIADRFTEPINCLHPRVIELLEELDAVKNFFYGRFFNFIKVEGKEYVIEYNKNKIPLGETLLEAMQNFCWIENYPKEDLRQLLKKAKTNLQREINSKRKRMANYESFISGMLKNITNIVPQCPPGAEKDLLKLIVVAIEEDLAEKTKSKLI